MNIVYKGALPYAKPVSQKLLLCSSPVRERSEGTFVISYFIDEDTEAYRDLLRSHSQLVSEPGGPSELASFFK